MKINRLKGVFALVVLAAIAVISWPSNGGISYLTADSVLLMQKKVMQTMGYAAADADMKILFINDVHLDPNFESSVKV